MTTDRIALVADAFVPFAEHVGRHTGDTLSRLLQFGCVACQSDGAPEGETLAGQGGEQVGVFDHADDLTARRHNRHVHALLQHVHQHGLSGQIGG